VALQDPVAYSLSWVSRLSSVRLATLASLVLLLRLALAECTAPKAPEALLCPLVAMALMGTRP